MPKPAWARVVGFWPLIVAAACLSVSLTSARIGSPSGRKSLYAHVRLVIAPLKISAPHWKVTNGGTAVGVPPLLPARHLHRVQQRGGGRAHGHLVRRELWSKSRLSSIWRGWPPPNSGSVKHVPVTGLYFHSLDFVSEYSVGLK